MKITRIQMMGMIVAAVTILVDLIFLLHEKIFYFILGIALVIGALPFFITFLLQTEKEMEKEAEYFSPKKRMTGVS